MKIEKDTDVLLINVPISRGAKLKKASASILSMPPLGLLYIASSLIEEGYRTSFIDLAVENMSKSDFTDILKESNAKIFGISTYFESWSATKSLISAIKEFNSEAIVIGGGVCSNSSDQKMIEELGFDYISLGEGELSFVNLCNSLLKNTDLNKCAGISYKNNYGEMVRREAVRISNLDELVFPDRNLIKLDKYVYPFTISTARGCPGRCVFCSSYSFWGKNIYLRSVENIILEIKDIASNFDSNEFFIVDDTFTMIPERTKKFCELLLKIGRDFTWGCESRADIVDEDLLKIMYNSGCKMIQFGLESADNDILKSINKNITFEQVEKASKLAHNIGFDINVSVIIGHASDTKETIEYTIEKARLLKEKYSANVLFSINTPYPGTDLYKKADEYGIEILTDNFDFYSTDNAIINTRNLTSYDLRYYYNTILKERNSNL